VKAVALLVVGLTLSLLFPQAQDASTQSSPRELLDARRPLTSTEIASVLDASHVALADKTFRLSFGFAPGPEVLMGSAGRPSRIRLSYGLVGGTVSGSGERRQWREQITRIVDYTNRPARQCDGSTATATAAATEVAGELVIEYTHRRTTDDRQPSGWTVIARRRAEREAAMPGLIAVFEMLRGGSAGSIEGLTSGDHQQIGDRTARGFVARFVPLHNERSHTSQPPLIGDPLPNVTGERPPAQESKPVQTLWIDTESLLPLRWEATDHGRRLQHYDFIFEPLDLRLPAELAATAPPDCIR
jgi:hypothetical protein